MKAIILAAGQGTRLRPLTDDRPKCLVPVLGLPIIEHALQSLSKAGIDDVTIVTGYRADTLAYLPARKIYNADYATTNMVHSLFCAEHELQGDVMIVYGDILFAPWVITQLRREEASLAIGINTEWLQLWRQRMDSPLDDAETLRLDTDGFVREIGKKPKSLEEVEGQYMGLIQIRASAIDRVRAFYRSLDRAALYDGKTVPQMFMTSFLQYLVDRAMPIKGVGIAGGWFEVDTPEDAALCERLGPALLTGSR